MHEYEGVGGPVKRKEMRARRVEVTEMTRKIGVSAIGWWVRWEGDN